VRLTVPVVTLSRVKVAPVAGDMIVVRRWHGLHRLTDGTPVIGENLAAIRRACLHRAADCGSDRGDQDALGVSL
jgi:hypothetical protein